jgi:hypothetical protein
VAEIAESLAAEVAERRAPVAPENPS